ncbi:MAG: transposase [Candidatus Nitrosopolaris sp.]
MLEGLEGEDAGNICTCSLLGIIKGEKVSLDCSIIWAWFKDCRWSNNPRHDKKECRRNRSRDRDASWTWDHHREKYVYGYKVHVVLDSDSGLPVMLTITKAGYVENRTVSWFGIAESTSSKSGNS